MSHRVRRIELAGLFLAAALSGCGTTSPSVPSTFVAVETPSPDEPDAVRFRSAVGLRADAGYVRVVASDPAASSVEFGVPLLPDEIAELEARPRDGDAVRAAIQAYAELHLDEFAGWYLDRDRAGALTTMWTDHLDRHVLAIGALVHPAASVAFRSARFSLASLNALQERISADWDWMRGAGIAPLGVGINEIGNRVELDVSSTDPAAPFTVAAHYAAPLGMLEVRSDGTGAALVPIATVRGIVVTASGAAPGENTYLVVTRGPGPGRCGGDVDEIAHGVGPDGRFQILCAAGSWTIAIQDAPIGGPNGIDLGHLDVLVPGGGVVDIIITLDPH